MHTLAILLLSPLLPLLATALTITSPTTGTKIYPSNPWNITWTLPSTDSSNSSTNPPQINLYLSGPTPATLAVNVSTDTLFYTVSAAAVYIGGSGVETGFTVKADTPGAMGNEYIASSGVFTMVETKGGNPSASATTSGAAAAATSSAAEVDRVGRGQGGRAIAAWLGLLVVGWL